MIIKSHNHGLPLLQVPQPNVQKSHSIILTAEESIQLNQQVKLSANPNSNITHLGHAAMVLALLRSAPLKSYPTAQSLYSPCWLNGRRYLQHPHSKSHIPICLSFAPIVFPDLQELKVEKSAGKASVKQTLMNACGIATQEYMKIRERKNMLPPSINIMEDIGKAMWVHK